jgi:RpiB/LacA/LacB family sugar-phosphate isomerase
MIYIASDKHGYKAILFAEEYLRSHNLEYKNLGVNNASEDRKLEDVIPNVVRKVRENENNKGILSCGTGIGVEVGVNKFSGIRACLATNEKLAEWAVVYDKCNVLCLSGWDVTKENVFRILDGWFNSTYDGDEDRLKMFKEFDAWH